MNMIQKMEQYGVEIRNKDREQLFKKRRQQFMQISEAQNNESIGIQKLQELSIKFMDSDQPYQIRLSFLLGAINLTSNGIYIDIKQIVDENSHSAIKIILNTEGLINQLKLTVYNENLPLSFREYTLQLLAQSLNSHYQQCEELLKHEMLEFMVVLAKMSFASKQFTFLIHSLTGLGYLVGHNMKIRDYLVKEDIDKLILEGLQNIDISLQITLAKSVAYIMNCWFRDKMDNIMIDSYLEIAKQLQKYEIDDEYLEDLIWFYYQLTAQVLNQLKSDQIACDQFINTLFTIGVLPDVVKKKIRKFNFIGSVAGVRLLIKIINIYSNTDLLLQIFMDDIVEIITKSLTIDVNMIKIEMLKLVNAIVSRKSQTNLVALYFNIFVDIYHTTNRVQIDVLNILAKSDFIHYSEEQLNILLEIASQIIQFSNDNKSDKMCQALQIIIKLPRERVVALLPYIQGLFYSPNQEVFQLSQLLLKEFDNLEIE